MTMQRGQTGERYVYYRDRSRGHDVTVYAQQIEALRYESGFDVFAEDTHVHHECPRDVNLWEWLELVTEDEHAEKEPHVANLD